jgi:hypothetical protein
MLPRWSLTARPGMPADRCVPDFNIHTAFLAIELSVFKSDVYVEPAGQGNWLGRFSSDRRSWFRRLCDTRILLIKF